MYSRAGAYPGTTDDAGMPRIFLPTRRRGMPSCHGLGHICEVTETLMVPDPHLVSVKRLFPAPRLWHGQNLQDILVTLGYDIDTPGKIWPAEDRQWIAFTEDTPLYRFSRTESGRYARSRQEKMTPGARGDLHRGTSLCATYLHFSTQSAMRKRVSRFMEGKLSGLSREKD